jgi:peptide/nickel transport system ATP-binding protein
MRSKDIEAIPGSPPDLRFLSPGCSFAPRCKFAISDCNVSVPPIGLVGPAHTARCIRLGDLFAPDALGASRARH